MSNNGEVTGKLDDSHHPKQLLFGEFVKPRPFHGPKQHWRVIAADLNMFNVPSKDVHNLTRN